MRKNKRGRRINEKVRNRHMAKFREKVGGYFCNECGEDLRKSYHHFLCNKCWKQKNKKR